MNRRYYLPCDCKDLNHMVVLEVEPPDEYDDFPAFHIHVQLSHWLSFFQRVKAAFKYVFRINNEFCDHWSSCFTNDIDQVRRIRELAEDYEVLHARALSKFETSQAIKAITKELDKL